MQQYLIRRISHFTTGRVSIASSENSRSQASETMMIMFLKRNQCIGSKKLERTVQVAVEIY